MSVVLVDSGGANIGSLRYALARLGVEASMSADVATIRAAGHVILPGVGAASAGMRRLRELGLVEALRSLTQPVLGVCLGMQLLCTHSEEGDVDGLGLIDTPVRALQATPGLRVPHMGWNRVRKAGAGPCWLDAPEGWVYFVHSYAVPECAATLMSCEHGTRFSAAIGRANFTGVQFHPERSGRYGTDLLRRFLET